MKQIIYLLLIMTIFCGCNYKPKSVTQITGHCFAIPDYKKTVCLEQEFDSLYPVLYIDKNRYEMRDRKFSKLKMYVMMVVEIDGNSVVFSNIDYSIKVKFDNLINNDCNQIKIQDMYYVIVKRIYLSDSVVVLNGIKEDLPSGEENVYSNNSRTMDMENINNSDNSDITGTMDEMGGDGYDVEDP